MGAGRHDAFYRGRKNFETCPLKNWTQIRDFPAPHKSRFRDWFADRETSERTKEEQ
ncbi:lactate utilization protein LutB domain-containing protein [Bacillus subtilis]